MNTSDAIREGVKIGIDIARRHPEKTAKELLADVDNIQTQLHKLSTKQLKKIINAP